MNKKPSTSQNAIALCALIALIFLALQSEFISGVFYIIFVVFLAPLAFGLGLLVLLVGGVFLLIRVAAHNSWQSTLGIFMGLMGVFYLAVQIMKG